MIHSVMYPTDTDPASVTPLCAGLCAGKRGKKDPDQHALPEAALKGTGVSSLEITSWTSWPHR